MDKQKEELLKQIKYFKELNKKYNTDYKLSDTRVSFYCMNKGSKLFEILKAFPFKSLKDLDLRSNQLTDLTPLTTCNLIDIEFLNIAENSLTIIDPLKNCIMKKLKELNLFNNKITSIEIFSECDWKNLTILDLSNNQISDIEVLSKDSKNFFPELTKLNLSDNSISSIDNLVKKSEKNLYPKLTHLYLSHNKISSINSIIDSFPNLQEFYLIGNQLTKIDFLSNLNNNNNTNLNSDLKNLKILWLTENQISDLNPLIKASIDSFDLLKELYLSLNQIKNIECLSKCHFEKLEALFLNDNQIDNIEVLSKCNLNKVKNLYLNNNKIKEIDIIGKSYENFTDLENLNLMNNLIENADGLFKSELFKQLKCVNLRFNQISNIDVMKEMKCDKLNTLEIRGNKIDKKLNKELIQELKNKSFRLLI